MNALVSVIIPVYNGEKTVALCLTSVFSSSYKDMEVLVVDDGSSDDTLRIIRQFPCQALLMATNAGPAAARNRGAEASHGEILFFLDSDILVTPGTIEQIVETFHRQPDVSALFCSYQKETLPSNFISAYKNILHHYTHQISREDAATFCGGFGAIRREVFFRFNGFNAQHRSLEDIELGYRLHHAGYKIFLNKSIQLTHCKRYSLGDLVRSDVLNRAIPWTKLMFNKKMFRADLNTKINNVVSVPLAFLILFKLLLLPVMPGSGYLWALVVAAFLGLNCHFYLFVAKEKGCFFTVKTILMNWFNYLYSGIGLMIGIFELLKESWMKPRGSLSPTEPLRTPKSAKPPTVLTKE